MELSKEHSVKDETIVFTESQTKGRGQQGSGWQSEASKSLTFSILKRLNGLPVSSQTSIAFAVALGVQNALRTFDIPDVSIKWPNDILSYNKKLAGILIENRIKEGKVSASVVGIGLNVNNSFFDHLPCAGSMLITSGREFDLNDVLHGVCKSVLSELKKVVPNHLQSLHEEYESSLFRKDKVTVFENSSGEQFNGIIRGVTTFGKLVIELVDESRQEFQLKEIKMLY